MSEQLLRVYPADELGRDGYPIAWHKPSAGLPAIKDLIRRDAGNRCVRCGHPYLAGTHGTGEWSPCDERCTHDGEIRVWVPCEGFPENDDWFHTTALRPVGPMIAESSQIYEARWRILTVHHLNGDKADCRWWNLAALCQRCHLEIQGRVRLEQIYPFEHSDWFKPYAAGYYAAAYCGEDLTRVETLARLDELLALELMGGTA